MDVMREPGRALNRDIAKGEAVEAEIDVFISRRDAKREVWVGSDGFAYSRGGKA